MNGCASNYPTSPPEQIANDTAVSESNYDNTVKYQSREVFTPVKRGIKQDHQRYLLRTWKDKETERLTHQLYVSIWYNTGNWRFYYSANHEDGEVAEFTVVDRDADCHRGCTYTETVGISLTTEYLKENTLTGFTVRLNSKGGFKNIVTVSPNYVQGHLMAIGNK